MTPHAPPMFEPDEILQILHGRGSVQAEGTAAVSVRYRVVIERRDGVVRASGTLVAGHDDLRPVWIRPDSILRLGSGERIEISITDLVDDEAEFESTGRVAPV